MTNSFTRVRAALALLMSIGFMALLISADAFNIGKPNESTLTLYFLVATQFLYCIVLTIAAAMVLANPDKARRWNPVVLFLVAISLTVVHALVLLLDRAINYSGAWTDVAIDAVAGVIFFALLSSKPPSPMKTL